jgi:hypothetical protein
MSFTAPIGTLEERNSGIIWPGRWIDALGYDKHYSYGYHTGADLNLNFPHWNQDAHSDVCAIGDGKVTYAQIYSKKVWGAIIIIDHGEVDGSPLFSRYAHVENIRVADGQDVQTGEIIAAVGNGEGLFPYHLHFDISTTDILRDKPWHWPGEKRALVHMHYVNPQDWLQPHVTTDAEEVIPTTQVFYVIATLGLRVRQGHGLSAVPVGALTYGSRVVIVESSKLDEDSYTWGQIRGGHFNGDWVALGRADQSEMFLSVNPPGS